MNSRAAEFAALLIKWRNQAVYSQADVASILKIDATSVAKWEKGKGMPLVKDLKVLARIYEVAKDKFFEPYLAAIVEDVSKRMHRDWHSEKRNT